MADKKQFDRNATNPVNSEAIVGLSPFGSMTVSAFYFASSFYNYSKI